jgi:hypothetical protein
MKNNGKSAWLLFAIVICAHPVLAQKVGTTSMQFLKVMPCARATALGDAYSVWASGAEAVFWNPSGVALVQGQEFSSTYIDWIFDARQGALSYATNVSDLGAVGLQIQYVDYGEFEETSLLAQYMQNETAPGMTGRTFHPFAYLVGLTYARNLTDKFSTGLTVKYVHESLFNGDMASAMVRRGVFENVKTWGSGLLFDFGVRYNTGFRSIQIAAAVQSFGAEIEYAKESSLAPLLFRFGAAADLIGNDPLFFKQEDNRLSIAFDLFQPNDYDQQEHVGLEYEFANTFALRAGYKFRYDSEGLTLGGGIRHTLGSVGLSLDYSYGSVGTYLGHVQRISLGATLQ